MPSLRSRRAALPFDPRLGARHPLMWPLARAAAPFAHDDDWPPVATWQAVFAEAVTAPVTFVAAAPRGRGRLRRERARATRYDESIIAAGRVPSRQRSWHDFLNALVWGTFPRAKAALHRRQARLIAANGDRDHRSRAQDGLAMIDEGGVIALGRRFIVFGHAVYEGFVFGVPGMTARLVRVAPGAELDVPAATAADLLARADAALAAALDDATFSTLPEDLPRVFVPDDAPPPWRDPAARPTL